MDEGRTIVAAASGLVTATNDGEYDRCTTGDCDGGGGYGNYVWIQHADGKATLYAHLKEGSVLPAEGDLIACGEPLGEMGSSGHSTGPHLHFGVWAMSGIYHDPFWGDCSSAPSYWVDQGDYDALPGLDCGSVAPCAPQASLSCGDVVEGDTEGGGDTHGFYGCGEWVYSGPERSWRVATDRDEPVTVRVTGLGADLDLFLLESSACDATGCLASSNESESSDEGLTFDATAGHVYTLVLDGFEGAASPFRLSVDCAGSWPAQAAPGDSGGADDSGDPRHPHDEHKASAGCGCASADAATGRAGLLLALGLALARRHRLLG